MDSSKEETSSTTKREVWKRKMDKRKNREGEKVPGISAIANLGLCVSINI